METEGHLQLLINVWTSPEWGDIWAEQPCEIESFERLGIPHDTPDTELWELCQQHEIVLVTGNRNAEATTRWKPPSTGWARLSVSRC
jgi:predicted nuclease of predicted toxin-antitoxin system